VDVLVEYVGPVGWTELGRAEDYLEILFAARVDLMSWDELKPRVRPYVEPDLLRVA
jgi:predicted nucleotidyltransferase